MTGYRKNMLATEKSVYEHVVYDSSGVEKTFTEQLEKNEAVKVYAKLPDWFKVPTPLGSYNPDWAVFTDDLRDKESAKIKCGEAHFLALAVGENPAKSIKARNVEDMMVHV